MVLLVSIYYVGLYVYLIVYLMVESSSSLFLLLFGIEFKGCFWPILTLALLVKIDISPKMKKTANKKKAILFIGDPTTVFGALV